MFNLLPALIGAGTSLIGGAMNRSAQRDANAANSPVGQVRQWEEAGINPIFGISSGGYIPQQATSLGDSFAGAGAQFQRGLELEHEDQLRETALEKENEKLREALDSLAKPVTPGHLKRYGGSLPLPDKGETESAETDGSNSDGDILDPSGILSDQRGERGADHNDGYNDLAAPAFKAFGIPFYGSGAFSSGQTIEDALGEGPLQWLTSPIIAADAVLATSYRGGKALREKMQKRKNDALWDEWYENQTQKKHRDPYKRVKRNKRGYVTGLN